MSIVLKPQHAHDIIPKMSGCQGAGTVASSSTTAMGVITVSSPAPCSFANVCCMCFSLYLFHLSSKLTCINEDLLNKTVVEVYLILSTERLSYKPPALKSVFFASHCWRFEMLPSMVPGWSDWSDWSSLCSQWSESVTPLLLPSSSVLRHLMSWPGDREQPVTTSNSSLFIVEFYCYLYWSTPYHHPPPH